MSERESHQPVVCFRHGSTSILTLHGSGNALSKVMVKSIHAALREAGDDSDVRVIILTGAGREAFSIGADLDELAQMDPDEAVEFLRSGLEIADLIETSGKPTIAAINGVAIGGGCEIALACHLRIAVPEAMLVASELSPGLTPVFGFSRRLPRLVGKARALEMVLAGTALSASEAERIGLVNHLAPPENLMSDAIGLADEIGRGAPLAMRRALEAINQGSELQEADALKLERELFSSCFATEDMREGVRAFLEKRSPAFKGK